MQRERSNGGLVPKSPGKSPYVQGPGTSIEYHSYRFVGRQPHTQSALSYTDTMTVESVAPIHPDNFAGKFHNPVLVVVKFFGHVTVFFRYPNLFNLLVLVSNSTFSYFLHRGTQTSLLEELGTKTMKLFQTLLLITLQPNTELCPKC